MKTKKRGPVSVPFRGGILEVWFDRSSRSWILAQKDAAGNQVGPTPRGDAEIFSTRESAICEFEKLMAAGELDSVC